MGENLMRAKYLAAFLLLAFAFGTTAASAMNIVITVSKRTQKMTVEVDGEQEYVWPVSTGARGYDTPSGEFRPFRMEEDHFSEEWDDAPMPHSIFFTGEGHAIHGSLYVKSLGKAVSHGCVRLAPDNATKLYALVKKAGMNHTRVVVSGGMDFGFGWSSFDRPGTGVKGRFSRRLLTN
jgi:lipoprotein-anchoring transpeptidase ErfK/SrfK